MTGDQDFVSLEREHWSDVAQAFDKCLSAMTDTCTPPLLAALGEIRGKQVLEIGCGPGHATAEATRGGAIVVATDLAPGMVAFASKERPDLDFRVANAEELPFEAASFDAAFGSFVIMLVPKPELAVEELARVLRPGGRLALTAWDAIARHRVLGMLEESKAEAGLQVAPVPGAPDLWRFAKEGEFENLLARHGFHDVEVERFEFNFEAPSGAALFAELEKVSPSLKMALAQGGTGAVDRVRAAFLRRATSYEKGDRIVVPCSANIASGRVGR